MKPCILIVGYDVDLRKLLHRVLDQHYDLVEADSGFDAVSQILVGEEKIELVITDLKMPGCHGKELIEMLPEKIPFIILSAFLHLPEFEQALQHLEPVAVLKKPFKPSVLREAIASGIVGGK